MTRLYPYQKKIYDELNTKLLKHRVVCMAAVTGFGKTELMAKFIEDNPGKRFLILAHGQTVLRTNFFERIVAKPKLKHSVLEITSHKDVGTKARIMVALPQTIHRHLNKLKPVDYLIIDEAHEYYLEDGDPSEKMMYEAILGWHGNGKEILLTASHYPLKRTEKVFFSREEALGVGQADDVTIEVIASSFDVNDISEAYTNHGEFSPSVDASQAIPGIIPYLKPKNFPVIVACHSIEAADELGLYLQKSKTFKGKYRVSHSRSDKDSLHMSAFKAGEFPILIVVQRGSIGFDFPDLLTYIDASFTRNLIRTEQMIGRLTRRHPNKKPKRFIKMALESRIDEAYLLIAGVMALGEREIYRTWDGMDKAVPVKGEILDRIKKHRGIPGGKCAPYLISFSQYLGIKSLEAITFKSALDMIRRLNGIREQKQAAIREWARSGKKRPSRIDDRDGYILFQAYLSPSSKCFEQGFMDEMKSIRPDWFSTLKSKSSSDEKKKQLIELAKSGAAKPKRGKHPLAEVLKQYVSKRLKRSCYDADFDRKIRKLAPAWFISGVGLNVGWKAAGGGSET